VAVLPELRELLAKAEAIDDQVVKLEASKQSLSQDCITLSARVKFLQQSIKDLEQQRDKSQVESDEKAHTRAEQIAEHETTLNDLAVELGTLRQSIEAAESTLEATRAEQDGCVAKAQAAVDECRLETDRLKTLNKTLADDNTAILAGIEARKRILADLDAEIVQKQAEIASEADKLAGKHAETERQVQELDTKHAAKRAELEDVTAELETRKTAVASVEGKHTEFLQYESTARKALAAKEQSLIEREALIADAELRLKRKGGILENAG